MDIAESLYESFLEEKREWLSAPGNCQCKTNEEGHLINEEGEVIDEDECPCYGDYLRDAIYDDDYVSSDAYACSFSW